MLEYDVNLTMPDDWKAHRTGIQFDCHRQFHIYFIPLNDAICCHLKEFCENQRT